jgi:hypothetical protein
VRLIREQLWRGYLTIAGLQASYAAVQAWRDKVPLDHVAELDWILALIGDELLVRELDGAMQ